MRIKTHLENTLYLSSLWSDLSKWGHYFIVLNLRKPNLRSSLSQLSAQELVIAGARMFFSPFDRRICQQARRVNKQHQLSQSSAKHLETYQRSVQFIRLLDWPVLMLQLATDGLQDCSPCNCTVRCNQLNISINFKSLTKSWEAYLRDRDRSIIIEVDLCINLGSPGQLNAGTEDCWGPSGPGPGAGRSPWGISTEAGTRECRLGWLQ